MRARIFAIAMGVVCVAGTASAACEMPSLVAAIPDGGGWRIHGRGPGPTGGHAGVGYRFIHSALDDRTRLVYSEIHDDEQAVTATAFWRRAAAWFTERGHAQEK